MFVKCILKSDFQTAIGFGMSVFKLCLNTQPSVSFGFFWKDFQMMEPYDPNIEEGRESSSILRGKNCFSCSKYTAINCLGVCSYITKGRTVLETINFPGEKKYWSCTLYIQ